MLVIVHCKATYAGDLHLAVRQLTEEGHKLAVCGDIAEHDLGHVSAAFLALRADDLELCMNDNTHSNIWMIRLLIDRAKVEAEDTIMVSAMPRDKEAARQLGIPCFDPYQFARLLGQVGDVQQLLKLE